MKRTTLRVRAKPLAKVGLCLACIVSGCFAQTQTTARIAGTVCDVTRAVILNAEIIARNDGTGEKINTSTDATGGYVLASLLPGTYQVTISAPGFAPAQFNNVQAEIGRTVQLNAFLKVATASSEITVSGVPTLVQAGSAEISTSIDARTLSAVPLPTRNFLQLAALTPGVSMPLTDNSALGRNSPNFAVNGARPSQNNLQINGIDANDISAHDFAAVAIPAPESITEVVVKTSMYDASVTGAGASVQLVTQSGTNSLHGAVYGYFRNTGLNANYPNLKAVGLGRPVLDRNVYGATLGGPIRKDRAFFFASYQGIQETNGATDQSLYKSVLIAPVPEGTPGLTDDRSEAALLADFQPILPPGTTSIDSTALAVLNAKLPDGGFLIPTPQQDGRVTGTAPSTYLEDQFNTNLDLRFSSRDSLAARFFFEDAREFWALGGGTFSSGSSLPGFGTKRDVSNRVLSVREIHRLSPTAVNEGLIGYNFIRTNETPQESMLDSDLGITRPTADTFPGLPLILLARDSGAASIGSSLTTILGDSPSLTVADVVSWQRVKHSLRLGGEFRHYQWDAHANVNAYGEIDFSTFDQFLLGNSDFSSIGVGLSDRNFRTNDYNLFVQDDWKLSRKLTLNLGLRYELNLPPCDTKGRIGGFDPALYRPRMELDSNGFPVGPPTGGIVMAGNAIPQYDLAGVPKVSNSVLRSVDPNNFGPRLGFAWSPTFSDRLVIRGGYGIFYHRPSFIYLGLDLFAPPFYATFLSYGQSFAHPFPSALPENQFPVIEPGIALTGTIMDRNNRTPYFQQFNASVEYQFERTMVLQLAYVGSRGVRLFRQLAVNQARIASAEHPMTNPVTGEVITANTPGNALLRAPFQGTDTSFFDLNQTSAQSTYHSLQVTLQRRASHGLEFQAAYSFSKSIDNASNAGGGALSDGTLDRSSGLDTGNVWGNQFGDRVNRGLSDFDRTHCFVLGSVWDAPEPSWTGSTRASQALFSNWQVSGIVIAMSGLPADVFDPTAGDLYGLTGARPNWAPGASGKSATRNIPPGYYFNPFLFALPMVLPNQPIPSAHDPTAIAPQGGNDIGNLGRNVLRGPSQSNFDLAVSKRIPVNKSRNVEVRADIFNVLNHASRSNPISDITVANSFDQSGRVVDPGDFGRTLGFDSSPRIVQFAVKMTF
jgi:Carboxypeptidase regulatory-like domain/TonB dependent receptor